MIPFGLTGVDQVTSTDVNLGVRINYTRSCEMKNNIIQNDNVHISVKY